MKRKTFIIISGRCSGKTRDVNSDHTAVDSKGFIMTMDNPHKDTSTIKHKKRKKNKR